MDISSGYYQLRKRIRIWRQRVKTRKELARLDLRELKDIGATQLDQRLEVNKRFWQA